MPSRRSARGGTEAGRDYGSARSKPLPEASEKLTTQPASVDAPTRKWVRAQLKDVVRGVGAGLAEFVGKKLAPLRAEIEQGRRASEAIGRVVDRLSNELAVLRREFDLERKLEAQRNKRRVESLEVALLAAGRVPDVRDEAELPGNFSQWNGGGHAQ